MKKMAALIAVLALTGCASYYPMGSLYTGVKHGVQDAGSAGSKTGMACSHSILSLFATGDASIAAAKANGGISTVSTVDYKVENVLGIYGEYCTVVTGN